MGSDLVCHYTPIGYLGFDYPYTKYLTLKYIKKSKMINIPCVSVRIIFPKIMCLYLFWLCCAA